MFPSAIFSWGKKRSAPPDAAGTKLLGRSSSLPGGGFGFLSEDDATYAQVKSLERTTSCSIREIDAALDGHRKEARALRGSDRTGKSIEGSQHGGTADLGIRHPTAFAEARCFSTYIPSGCIFVGHTNTDMDSVASAIGAAHLFDGVAPQRAHAEWRDRVRPRVCWLRRMGRPRGGRPRHWRIGPWRGGTQGADGGGEGAGRRWEQCQRDLPAILRRRARGDRPERRAPRHRPRRPQ